MVSRGFDVLMAVVTLDRYARRLESAATQLAKGSHLLHRLTHNVRMCQEGFWWTASSVVSEELVARLVELAGCPFFLLDRLTGWFAGLLERNNSTDSNAEEAYQSNNLELNNCRQMIPCKEIH